MLKLLQCARQVFAWNVALCLLMLSHANAPGQQVIQVRWATTLASPPVSFGSLQPGLAGAIRMGMASMPEETIISAGLLQGEQLGLSPSDAGTLRDLFSAYYARMRRSVLFKQAPSALSYCFSESKPGSGLATVYLPARISNRTKSIVFLHGYGGSLLAYLHYLSTVFPDQVIICPAYGINTAEIPNGYIEQARQAVVSHIKTDPGKPLLMGLSAGAFGACRTFARKPEAFRAMVCIAAYPAPDAVQNFKRDMTVRFICGGRESYVSSGYFEQQMLALKPKVRSLDWKVIDGAGHFFLLSHEQATKQALARWAN